MTLLTYYQEATCTFSAERIKLNRIKRGGLLKHQVFQKITYLCVNVPMFLILSPVILHKAFQLSRGFWGQYNPFEMDTI